MTIKEKNFVEKWNEMLKAAKEMEQEGDLKTEFAFKLTSLDNYMKERQKVAHALNGCFLENDYRIEERA